MTDKALKLVLMFDPEIRGFKSAAHNLSAAQAVEHLEQFSGDPQDRIIDQDQRHRTSDPLKCKACKKVAEELTGKHTASAPGSEQAEEETAHAESEAD